MVHKSNALPVLTIGQFETHETDTAVYVNRFSEHVRKHHAHILRPHKHDFYLTVFFTCGSGFHEIDFVRYPIAPGAVFMLQPGQTHHWEFSADTEGWVFFHSDAFRNFHMQGWSLNDPAFFWSSREVQAVIPDPKASESLWRYCDELWIEYCHPDQPFHQRKLALLIQTIYIELARTATVTEHVNGDAVDYLPRFQMLQQLIDAHFKEEKSPGFYAEKLHISERHLNRIVHRFTGKSTLQLITARVILEAKRLLASGQLRPGETALFLGFDAYAYFSQLFRKHCGVSPKAFRKQYD